MRAYVLSDLHYETYNYKFKIPTGDVLLVAGDCVNLNNRVNRERAVEFLNRLSGNFEKVFYVLGNHEYFHMDVTEAHDVATEVLSGCGIELLDNSSSVYNGVKFIGSTLWSNCSNNESIKYTVEHSVSDFKYIKKHGYKLSMADVTKMNSAAKAYLADELAEGTGVVVTHFSPSLRSATAEHSMYTDHYACNSIESLVSKARLWVHGHYHHSCSYLIDHTPVCCNPKGGLDVNPDFAPCMALTL